MFLHSSVQAGRESQEEENEKRFNKKDQNWFISRTPGGARPSNRF
jgi:hypothetical protein